jgi:carboxyl-terminal processing protease
VKLRRAAGALTCMAMALSIGSSAAPVRRPADADAAAVSPAARRYLTEALDIIRSNAVERGRVDWAYQERIALRVAAGARTPADTHPAIASAITALGDPHSRFLPPVEVQRWSGTDLARRVPNGRTIGRRLGYLKVPGILGSEAAAADYARAGAAALQRVDRSSPCGWVVDLREDDGGNMWPMLAVLAPLLGDGTLGYFQDADAKRTGWGLHAGAPVLDGAPIPGLGRHTYRLRHGVPPVALLTGPRTISAGEIVVIAFKGRPGTRAFGLPTAGLATATEGFSLSDGAILLLTTAYNVDRNGTLYGNTPIAPDEAPTGPDTDPPLRAAAAWLHEQPICRAADPG